jgi:hypothetical protein
VFDFEVAREFQSAKMSSLHFRIKHNLDEAHRKQINAVQKHRLDRMLFRTALHGVLKTRQVKSDQCLHVPTA